MAGKVREAGRKGERTKKIGTRKGQKMEEKRYEKMKEDGMKREKEGSGGGGVSKP